MPGYKFGYIDGQSRPFTIIEAENHDDFFKKKLPEWEKKTGFTALRNTVMTTDLLPQKVQDPAIPKHVAESAAQQQFMADNFTSDVR